MLLSRYTQCYTCSSAIDLKDTPSYHLVRGQQNRNLFYYTHTACFEDEAEHTHQSSEIYEITSPCTLCNKPNAAYQCSASDCTNSFHYDCLDHQMCFTTVNNDSQTDVFAPKYTNIITKGLQEHRNGMYRLLCATHLQQRLEAISLLNPTQYLQITEAYPQLPALTSPAAIAAVAQHQAATKPKQQTTPVTARQSLPHNTPRSSTPTRGNTPAQLNVPLPAAPAKRVIQPAPPVAYLPVCSVSAMWAARHLAETCIAQMRRERELTENMLPRDPPVLKAENAGAHGAGKASATERERSSVAPGMTNDSKSSPDVIDCADDIDEDFLMPLDSTKSETLEPQPKDTTPPPSANTITSAPAAPAAPANAAAESSSATSALQLRNGLLLTAQDLCAATSAVLTGSLSSLPEHLTDKRVLTPEAMLARGDATNTDTSPMSFMSSAPAASGVRTRPYTVPPRLPVAQLMHPYHMLPGYRQYDPRIALNEFHSLVGDTPQRNKHVSSSKVPIDQLVRMVEHAAPVFHTPTTPLTKAADATPSRMTDDDADVPTTSTRKPTNAASARASLRYELFAPARSCAVEWGQAFAATGGKTSARMRSGQQQLLAMRRTRSGASDGIAGTPKSPITVDRDRNRMSDDVDAADILEDSSLASPSPSASASSLQAAQAVSALPVRGVVMERLVECFLAISAKHAVSAASEVIKEAHAVAQAESAAFEKALSVPASTAPTRGSLVVSDKLFTGEPLSSRKLVMPPLRAPGGTPRSPPGSPLIPAFAPVRVPSAAANSPKCSWQAQALSELQTGLTPLLSACSDNENYRVHANGMAANALLYLTRLRTRVNESFWKHTTLRQRRNASRAANMRKLKLAWQNKQALGLSGRRRPSVVSTDHAMAPLNRSGAQSLMLCSALPIPLPPQPNMRSKTRKQRLSALSNAAFWRVIQEYMLRNLLDVEMTRYLLRFKLRYGSKSTFAYDAANRYGNYTVCVAGEGAGSGLAGIISSKRGGNATTASRFKRVRLMGMGGMGMGMGGGPEEQMPVEEESCALCDAAALYGSRKRKDKCPHMKPKPTTSARSSVPPLTTAQIMAAVDPVVLAELRRAAALSYSGVHYSDTMSTHAARMLKWTAVEVAFQAHFHAAASQRAREAAVWLDKALAPPALTGSNTLIRALERAMLPDVTSISIMHPNDFSTFLPMPDAIANAVQTGKDPKKCLISIPKQIRRSSYIPLEDRKLPGLVGLVKCLQEQLPVRINVDALETSLRIAQMQESNTPAPNTTDNPLTHMLKANPGLCLPGLATSIVVDPVAPPPPPPEPVVEVPAPLLSVDDLINFNRRSKSATDQATVTPIASPPAPADTPADSKVSETKSDVAPEPTSTSSSSSSSTSSTAPASATTASSDVLLPPHVIEAPLILSIGPVDASAIVERKTQVSSIYSNLQKQAQERSAVIQQRLAKTEQLLSEMRYLESSLRSIHTRFGTSLVQWTKTKKTVVNTANRIFHKEKEREPFVNMYHACAQKCVDLTEQLKLLELEARTPTVRNSSKLIAENMQQICKLQDELLRTQQHMQQLQLHDQKNLVFAKQNTDNLVKYVQRINCIVRVIHMSCVDMASKQATLQSKLELLQRMAIAYPAVKAADDEMNRKIADVKLNLQALDRSLKLTSSSSL